jgi:hypothetical protein
MAANEMQQVEYGDFLLNLLLSQYKSKEKMIGLFQNTGDLVYDPMEDILFKIYNMCDLDNSSGYYLDMAASLIGLQRMPIRVPADVWILDETDFTDHRFGDADYIIFEECPDRIFRDCIKSYAYTQTCYGSIPDVLITLGYILDVDPTTIEIENPSNRVWNITIPNSVSIVEGRRYLLGIGGNDYRTPNGGYLWARPAGVVFNISYT